MKKANQASKLASYSHRPNLQGKEQFIRTVPEKNYICSQLGTIQIGLFITQVFYYSLNLERTKNLSFFHPTDCLLAMGETEVDQEN